VDGGYRVTGQWPFVSRAHDASWFLFLPRRMDGDKLRLNAQGVPMQIWAFVF
jgi:alkylation response protein AidB-like acyl-CoA dehydrogenase